MVFVDVDMFYKSAHNLL